MSIRNSLLVLLFGSALGFMLSREQQRGTLEPFDRIHREFLKANPPAGQRASSLNAPAVVLARLDDVDQPNRVFGAWPLEERDWQGILQNVAGYSPAATAIAAPLPFEKAGSGLESAAAAIPHLSVPAPASMAASDGEARFPPSLPVLSVSGQVNEIPEFKSVRPPAISGAAAAGEIDLVPRDKKLTVEGDWCRVPLLARMGDRVVPTLALRALLEWANVPVKDVTVQPGLAITAGKSLRIEIDEGGFFRYYLSLAPPVPSVNADEFSLTREQAVANLAPDDPARKVLAKLANSVLWFGHDDAAARLLKLPNGTPVSPAELTARALAAIQTSSFMRPLPQPHQWIAPGATLLFCLWLTHWRKSRLWPGALSAALVLGAVSLYLYHLDHWWMPLLPSLALLAATLVLSYLLPSPGSKPVPTPAVLPAAKPVPAPAPTRLTHARLQELARPATDTARMSPKSPLPALPVLLPPPDPEPAPPAAPPRAKKGRRKRR